MAWRVEFLTEALFNEMEAMPADIGASFARIVRLIQEIGLERVREPYV
jgi:hypothetical protein